MNYKIQNIEPFNDTYYRSCFFNSFFSVIRHYGKNILPYLMYDITVYVLYEEDVLLRSEFTFFEETDLDRTLTRQGIKMQTLVEQDNIIPYLYKNLRNDRPVILWIDAFYIPYRKDVYHTLHWPHSILVYGYDEGDESFYVIDHTWRESLSYEKKKLTASALAESYDAYLKMYLSSENVSESCYVFEKNREHSMESIEEYRDIYRNCLLNHRRTIQRSLENLQLFSNSISYTSLINNIDYMKQLVEGINSIILNKDFELYRFAHFFPYLDNWFELQKKITSRWSIVRAKLLKVVFSNKKENDLSDVVASQIKSIIQEEYAGYKILMTKL